MEPSAQEIEVEKEHTRKVISYYDKSITELTDSLPDLERMSSAIKAMKIHEDNVKGTISYLQKQRSQLADYLKSLG